MKGKTKAVTPHDVSRLCDRIEDFSRRIGTDTGESLADEIVGAYAYAGTIGIREGYKSEKDMLADREAILEDLAEAPGKFLEAVELLGLDYYSHKRSQQDAA